MPGFGSVAIEAGIERETAAGYLVHGRRNPVTDKLCAALAVGAGPEQRKT